MPVDTGDTAWMLTSTAIVADDDHPRARALLWRHGAQEERARDVMQSFAITCLITVLWMVIGYSLAFGEWRRAQCYVGGLESVAERRRTGTSRRSASGRRDGRLHHPRSVFVTFQMTFAIITPALIIGAFADRMKFSALMCSWRCGRSSSTRRSRTGCGAAAGSSRIGRARLRRRHGRAHQCRRRRPGRAIVLGKRSRLRHREHGAAQPDLSVIGASLLWVGWFGFNAGSAVGPTAARRHGDGWSRRSPRRRGARLDVREWMTQGKPSVLGVISGAIAGLVAITPGRRLRRPAGALMIGARRRPRLLLGLRPRLKRALGYDDSLDVFGVHGVGGIVGAILTGVLPFSNSARCARRTRSMRW
jgi:ammonium transporter, Amt family